MEALPYLSQPNLMSLKHPASTRADTLVGESGHNHSSKFLRKAINIKSLRETSAIADDAESISSIQLLSNNNNMPRLYEKMETAVAPYTDTN